ncbi:hypothetical protein TELCIR_11703 [Teladorsagia circumcincta]|uniref:Uncharacterized protein n=1 Tax=Teladorsagia circumcincta TaxID=45464 RepID=A0A2G9UAQ8_TELCI|nr:hypothetical protein TELCIR_11703 [Teladorsagia circumcincta]
MEGTNFLAAEAAMHRHREAATLHKRHLDQAALTREFTSLLILPSDAIADPRSEYTSIRDYEGSLRKVLDFVNKQPQPKQVRYSASKSDTDSECLPTFKHFHRFLLAVLAGTHVGAPLR